METLINFVIGLIFGLSIGGLIGWFVMVILFYIKTGKIEDPEGK